MITKIKFFKNLTIWQKLFILPFLFSILYFIFSLPVASAAQIFFETNRQEVIVNQQFEVTLKLDTQNQAINAIEGKISFTDNLKLISINDANSLVTLWIQRPIKKDRNIIFSGIIPGGYTGNLDPNSKKIQPGNIMRLIFVAEKAGIAQLIFESGRVLLNDGEGTEAPLFVYNLQLNVVEGIVESGAGVIENKDNIPPEPFTPEIYRDPTFNKWFLRFNARDNQSGIDHYEVLERKEFNLFGLKFNGLSSWIKTESPYLLKDQKLKSYIYVKAFDRANNERISVLVPQVAPAWYENYLIWFIIIILVIISYFVRKNIWRKRLLIR